MGNKPYRTPTMPRITRAQEPKLYRLEEKAHAAFMASAKHLGEVLGLDPAAFYQEALPEALCSFLKGWDMQAVRLACETWMERHPRESVEG